MQGSPPQSAALEQSPACIPLDVDVDVDIEELVVVLIVAAEVEPPEPPEPVVVSTVEPHAARPSTVATAAHEREAVSARDDAWCISAVYRFAGALRGAVRSVYSPRSRKSSSWFVAPGDPNQTVSASRRPSSEPAPTHAT